MPKKRRPLLKPRTLTKKQSGASFTDHQTVDQTDKDLKELNSPLDVGRQCCVHLCGGKMGICR